MIHIIYVTYLYHSPLVNQIWITMSTGPNMTCWWRDHYTHQWHLIFCEPRTLALLSDAYDEHMHVVRVADEETFDLCSLNSALKKFLTTNWKWFKCSLIPVTTFDDFHQWQPRFLDTVIFLFTKNQCWKISGTYSALMKCFGPFGLWWS